MLSDKDRIFTNLYGHPRLAAGGRAEARRLGRHQGDPRSRAATAIIEEMKASGLRGRGGAGFPTGMKWSFMPKADRRPAALSRGQCRRERARHLQGPRHPAPRSAQAGRGLPDRRLRDGRACLLHLYPRRVLQRGVEPAGRDRRGLCGRAASARTPAARAGISTSICIAAPAPISAARKPRCSKASRARRACRG